MSSRGRVQTKHEANFHVALLCEFDRGIICVYSPQTGRKPTIAYRKIHFIQLFNPKSLKNKL